MMENNNLANRGATNVTYDSLVTSVIDLGLAAGQINVPRWLWFGAGQLDLQTGAVELNPGITLDEGARAFWDAVQRIGGRRPTE